MADATLSVLTVTLAGTTATGATASYATADTITIYEPTDGELDFSTLQIRFQSATTASATNYLVANSEFTGGEQGNYAFAVSSSRTIIIGGKGFDGSRFKHTATSGTAYAQILIAASTDAAITATQGPYSVSG